VLTNSGSFRRAAQRPQQTIQMKPYIAVPAIAGLVYRAWSHKSLTTVGIITAIAVAVIHAIHPWSVFFALLAVFFLAGNAATKVGTSNVLITLD